MPGKCFYPDFAANFAPIFANLGQVCGSTKLRQSAYWALKPERSTSWEVGVDHRLGPVQFGVTYFERDGENEIAFFSIFIRDA